MWTDEDLIAETEWSRTFSKQDGSGTYHQSKFIEGEAKITLNELAERWPRWSENERHDFCSAYSCGNTKSSGDIFRFLATDTTDLIRSTIALGVAVSLDTDEAYPILKKWASEAPIGHRANYFQAITVTNHPSASDSVNSEFDELCSHPQLMDDADWYNDIAMDLVWCIQHLLQLDVPAEYLRPIYAKLKTHPCQKIRDQVDRWLAKSFDGGGQQLRI